MKSAVIRVTGGAAGGGYLVQLFVDDGAAGWWDRPVADAEMKADLSLDPPELRDEGGTPVDPDFCRDLVRNRNDASGDFRNAGLYLGRLLLTGAVGGAWRREAGTDPVPGEPRPELRTLLDIGVKELRDLPWELASVGEIRPFTDARTPIARGRVRWEFQPDPIPWPIKVLVVVGAKAENIEEPTKNDELYTELAAVEDALGSMRNLVDFEVLRQPTRERVVTVYTKLEPHVFHFIGHGRVDGNEGVLDLHDSDDGSQEWRASDIVTTLGAKPPRLAIINACRSAGGADDPAPFLVAGAFESAGAWAVLGMQGDIRGDAAAACAEAIYGAFAADDPVDVALAKGRQAVIAKLTSATRDWALPVLTLSVPPGHLLAVTPAVTRQERQRIAGSTEFKEWRDSVDRSADRRRLWTDVHATDAERRLLIVRGQPSIGKSDLVRWVLEGCALRGIQVLYAGLDRNERYDCLDVIRQIKGDPASMSVVREPLPQMAFARLNRDLNHLLRGEPAPDTEPDGFVDDEKLPLKAGPEQLIRTIFTGFQSALVEAARTRPILIALDQADRVVETHFKNFLVPHLLVPIARGRLPGVRMIVAIGDEAWRDYGLEALRNADNEVRVELIDRREFVPTARRFLRHYKKQGPNFDKVVKAFEGLVEPQWSPGRWMFQLRALP